MDNDSSSHLIEVTVEAPAWCTAVTEPEALCRRVIARVLAREVATIQVEVSVLLAGDEEVRALNRTWRGKDAPTNVLSFPSGEIAATGFLGDVALAAETIRREAHEQEIALQDHVSHLVVHGVFHLLGFDHDDDEAAERMETLERAALASLGIADPYAAGVAP